MGGVLVVGSNGQVGREIAERAASASVSYVALNRQQLDVTQLDPVLRALGKYEPDLVVNASAYTAVDKAESHAEEAFAVNRDGAANLALACHRAGAPLIHISTDYVFDGEKAGPYVESDPVAPLNVYGASKLAGEELVREYCAEHLILRTSWVYGVYGQNFVKSMLRVGGERHLVKVVSDQRGTPTYAGDLADTILTLSARLLDIRGDGAWGTFHYAGQGQATWYDFARAIFQYTESAIGIVRVEAIGSAEYPTAAKRPMNSVLDCSHIWDKHRVRTRPWTDALRDMIDQLKLGSRPISEH